MATVTFHAIAVMENAKRETTRKKLLEIQHSLAREENVPLLQKIVELRDRIAHRLGYASWADYQIEPKMAKNAAFYTALTQLLSRQYDLIEKAIRERP